MNDSADSRRSPPSDPPDSTGDAAGRAEGSESVAADTKYGRFVLDYDSARLPARSAESVDRPETPTRRLD